MLGAGLVPDPGSTDMPPLPPTEAGEGSVAAEEQLARDDWDMMDLLPFDMEYDSELDLVAAMMLEDYGSDNEEDNLAVIDNAI
jgi:hypothetical protein